MTFGSLSSGTKFRFESESKFPFSGMARGPWIKTGARKYVHADDPDGTVYRVGSTSAKVAVSNPGGSMGARILSRSRNPGDELPASEWVPAHAVRFNSDGTVSIMTEEAAPVANRRRNVAAGFYDEEGYFHPIRASFDYSRKRAGEKPVRAKKAKKKKAKARRR